DAQRARGLQRALPGPLVPLVRRDREVAAVAEPRVDAVRPAPGADLGRRATARHQQLRRVGVAVGLADVADLLPPPVAEPAVAAARAAAADVGLEQDDVEIGLPLLEEPCGPQPRVPAAED